MGIMTMVGTHRMQKMDSCFTNFGKDEEVLVAFLSGVNQVFLAYLFLAMASSLIVEGRGSPYSPVPAPEDYDFELDSGLRRGAGHATSVTCMVILSVVAMMWVGCARMARNRRSVDLQIYDFTYYGTRRHQEHISSDFQRSLTVRR